MILIYIMINYNYNLKQKMLMISINNCFLKIIWINVYIILIKQ